MEKATEKHSISDIFLQVSRELTYLIPEIEAIEATVNQIAQAPEQGLGKEFANFQKLDLLTQIVSELAQFLEDASKGIPVDWKLTIQSAVANVRLHDLANRLENPQPESKQTTRLVSGDHCIFF